jgi:hypothetical protein
VPLAPGVNGVTPTDWYCEMPMVVMSELESAIKCELVGLIPILGDEISRLQLTAVTDVVAPQAALLPEISFFPTPGEMIASGTVDAVLIATPHQTHTPIGIAALQAGLHAEAVFVKRCFGNRN